MNTQLSMELDFPSFQDITERRWVSHLGKLNSALQDGTLTVDQGRVLWPQSILFVATPRHFIFELYGLQEEWNGLSSRAIEVESTLRYFYQFDYDQTNAAFRLDGRQASMMDICLLRNPDGGDIEDRFPFVRAWPTKLNYTGEGEDGALLEFGENFRSAYFDNSLIVNRLDAAFRTKHLLNCGIISKDWTEGEYTDDLTTYLEQTLHQAKNPPGAQIVPFERSQVAYMAAQFANTFLFSGNRETTIGDFLRNHPEFTKSALSCEDFRYELQLEWKEGNPEENETAIRPDLFLKRDDGFYDICELKLPLLGKESVTKAKRKRRRFLDYVEEGISQLANYDDYFSYEENKRYAEEEFDLPVQDPLLYLVVGSYENADVDEIREASRKLHNRFRLLDYDTLNGMFMSTLLQQDQPGTRAPGE